MSAVADFVAYNSRWRLASLITGAFFFVVLGLWMGGVFGIPLISNRYADVLIFSVGWFSVLFFGLCGVAALRRFFDPREQLQIGSFGIRWCPWSDQIIPWSEIEDVTVWTYSRQAALVLHLHDPALFPGRGLTGVFAGANRKLTGGDISISLTGTDRSFEEAVAAIVRFRS